MAVMLNTRDPVTGLEEYVQDIKPFHTKVLEVWSEFIYEDALNVNVVDTTQKIVNVELNRYHSHCATGFAMLPWGLLINGRDPKDVDGPDIPYGVGKTAPRNKVYQQFYEYVRRTNSANDPNYVPKKPTSAGSNNDYDLIIHQALWDAAKTFFAGILFTSDYWFDSYHKTLYERDGNMWREVDFHFAPFPPQDLSTDLWINSNFVHLFIRHGKKWKRYYDLGITNNPTMIFPPSWRSNWDQSDCWKFGENFVFTYITESIKFRMFNKHNTKVRVGVYDPTNNQGHKYDQQTRARIDYPITVYTTSTYDPISGIKYHDVEDSIVTNPTRTDSRIIADDGVDFLGFNVLREYKGVRLSHYKVWKVGTSGPVMAYESPIGKQTFEFKVVDGALRAYLGPGAIVTPFKEGDVVYVTSTDDLPSYFCALQDATRNRLQNQELSLPVQDQIAPNGTILQIGSRSLSNQTALKLKRYTPYRVKLLSGGKFGLLELEQDEVTVPPYMQSITHLPMIDPGYGKHYIGYGVPVPFIRTEEPVTPPPGATVGATITENVTIRYL